LRLLVLLLSAMVDLAGRQILRRSRLSLPERVDWLQRWCRRVLRILGVAPYVQGAPQAGVIVANHLSYLDILLFGSATPCVFVAKSEIRRWPLLGWLAAGAGTLFIDRNQRSQAHAVGERMLEVLRQGISIVFFPEGTTTDGSEVLRFHSSLFEYAVRAQVPVTSACVSYASPEASVGEDICYWGNAVLVPHLWRLNAIGQISGNLVFAEKSATYADRRTAAAATHAEVVEMLLALRSIPAQREHFFGLEAGPLPGYTKSLNSREQEI
jgi:1-acyl-sn-glycerol-3-phosphate acyltransferase